MQNCVQHLLARAPLIRKELNSLGHALPSIYLDMIETVRPRPQSESRFDFFLDEVASEYFKLPYPWQPAVRRLLNNAERSSYLDSLQHRFGEHALSLDPNFNAYLKSELEIANRKTRAKILCEQKISESMICDTAILRRDATGPSDLRKGFLEIARRFGFEKFSAIKSSANAFDMRSVDGSPCQLSLHIPDLPEVLKSKFLIVEFEFTEVSAQPFGISLICPGGAEYFRTGCFPGEVWFSFYIQCLFASLVQSTTGSSAL